MEPCVVTSFDQKYWTDWGTSWVASLKELARYEGKVLVINLGDLPFGAQTRLETLGFTVIPAIRRYKPPLDRFLTLAHYCRVNPGYYAYWEADAYFQAPLDGVFRTEQLVAVLDRTEFSPSKDKYSTGFLAGPAAAWDVFGSFLAFAAEFGNRSDQNILNAFARDFQGRVAEAEETWNYTAVTNLKWRDGFYLGNELVNVVHPPSPLKYNQEGRQFLFRERYRQLYAEWRSWLVNGNNLSVRSLLKTGKRFFKKKSP